MEDKISESLKMTKIVEKTKIEVVDTAKTETAEVTAETETTEEAAETEKTETEKNDPTLEGGSLRKRSPGR